MDIKAFRKGLKRMDKFQPKRLRALPFFQNKVFRVLLLILFPVCLYLAAELGQAQDMGALLQFTLHRAGVALFSILLTTGIFWVGTLLTRRAWAGGLTTGALYMICSAVEYYKRESSGSHLLFSDSYIHPYSAGFYDRGDTYSRYGFDRMLFADDLTVPVGTFHSGYVDDDTVYRQAEAIMAQTDGPDFIHITSMQNHMPYDDPAGQLSEYEYYLQGIEKSCGELADFLERLGKADEPCIVLFIGDHFPYFSGEDSIYQKLSINSENCGVLYEQSFLLWSNKGLAGPLPEETISAFYLPHLLYQAADLPENPFTEAVLGEMEKAPVYSVSLPQSGSSQLLDMLAYDRVLGEGYSAAR